MTEQPAASAAGGKTAVSTGIDVGRDLNGIVVVGDGAVLIVTQAPDGSRVSDYRGLLPKPARRDSINLLPRHSAAVIGRDRELSELRTAVGGNGLIQLCGPAGIGKSALLRHAARDLGPGPDGVVYLHAGDREAAEIAREIFKACYVAPDYVPSIVELQQYLQHLRLRIYVDDPRFSEAELKQLMDIVQNSALVFTTEHRIAGAAVRTVPVGGLDETASINLLAYHLNRSLRDEERPTAKELCAAANGSPLHLRRVAASSRGGLPEAKTFPSLLAALVRQQSPEASDVLHLIASVGGDDIAPIHLDALLGRADCDRVCRDLARAGLLTETDIGYRCPADVVAEALKSRGNRYPTDKLCSYLTGWAADAATSPDAVAGHHRILDVLVLRAERDGHPELGVALARAASPKLERSLHFSAWGTLLGAGWSAAEAAKDKDAKAYFLNEEGVRCLVTRKLGPAALLLAQAVLLWQELGILHKVQAAQHSAQFAAAHSFRTIGAHGTVAGAVRAHMAAIAHATPALLHTSTTTALNPAVQAVTPVINPAGPAFAPQPPLSAPPAHLAQPRPLINMHGSGHVANAAQTAQSAPGSGHVAHAAHHHKQVFDLSRHTHHATMAPSGHPGVNAPVHQSGTTTGPVHVGHHQHRQHIANAHHGAKAGASAHSAGSAAAVKTAVALAISASVFGGVALVNHLTNNPSQDPACQTAVPAIAQAAAPYNSVIPKFTSAMDGYNSAAGLGEQGDWGSVQSVGDEEVGNLQNVASAVQAARGVAATSAVASALDAMSSNVQGQINEIQSFLNRSVSSFDTSTLADQFNNSWDQVKSACGD